jgi:chaperone modulatory protein CbpM
MKATHYQLMVLQPHYELFGLEDVASRAGVHPEVVQRFIELGLIEPAVLRQDAPSGVMFDAHAVHRVRVIQRLRCDLGINLQGIAVILDLLDRLDESERGGHRGYQ